MLMYSPLFWFNIITVSIYLLNFLDAENTPPGEVVNVSVTSCSELRRCFKAILPFRDRMQRPGGSSTRNGSAQDQMLLTGLYYILFPPSW